MTEPPMIGLHGPAYIPRELLESARRELAAMPARLAVGDEPTALERIAYAVLRAAGHTPGGG